MKRQLTPEQQAAKKARREKFTGLWKQVSAMPDLERVQLANKCGIVTCDGRELSLCNTMLVILQCPGASIVGGFRQWLKYGRCVMKGQHGAMIWVPTGVKKDGETVSEPAPVAAQGAEAEVPDHRFIIGTVFDISQTQEIETGRTETPEAEQVASELIAA